MEHGKDFIEHEMDNCECIGGYLSPVHNLYEKKTNLKDNHRLNMAKLSVDDSKWIDVDDWEFNQEGYSTTVTVLEHFDEMLKKTLKNPENVKASLICGADLLQSFNVPNLWKYEDMEKVKYF
jgi:nicotinamide mononucleotide adenylyltransferase